MTVLVLSDEFDPTVDQVVMALDALRVPVCRVDLGRFPQRLTLDAQLEGHQWVGVLRTPEWETRLVGLRSVWYRSPTGFSFPDDLPPARRNHVEREARFGVGGVLTSLPVAWVNHPHRDADAAYKPRQLVIAAQTGLSVPRTLITNDPVAAERFHAESQHGVVVKTLASNVLYEEGQRKVGHTRKLTADDVRDFSGVEMTAHQFQEWVPKAYEVRLIVVGRKMFAVGIHTDDPAAFIDWRANYGALDYTHEEIPTAVGHAVTAFMKASGLNFSALDFVVRPDGRWVFLESNSGGQFGWLKVILGTSVIDALAELLAQGAN